MRSRLEKALIMKLNHQKSQEAMNFHDSTYSSVLNTFENQGTIVSGDIQNNLQGND
jgi:hypothetical protein